MITGDELSCFAPPLRTAGKAAGDLQVACSLLAWRFAMPPATFSETRRPG